MLRAGVMYTDGENEEWRLEDEHNNFKSAKLLYIGEKRNAYRVLVGRPESQVYDCWS
jgi:hypothetical protein